MKTISRIKSKCHLFFGTLSTRLKMDIISCLRGRALDVSGLSDMAGQERSKVSHALKTLLECGFVTSRKEGRRRIYSLNRDTTVPLLDLVERHVDRYCRVCARQKEAI